MENELILYHGSIKVVEKPLFNGSKPINDFGYGFYLTEDIELGKEWSCKESDKPGILNIYSLNLEGLKILDLTKEDFSPLNWIAILLKNRNFPMANNVGEDFKQFLIKNYMIDYSSYDVIIGLRADDSYFSFASDFAKNMTNIRQLEMALNAGKLGKQIVLKSKKAFDQIKFINYEYVDQNIYYYKRQQRDINAKRYYYDVILTKKQKKNDIYILDIIREKEDGK